MHGYTEKQLFELIRKTEELMDAGILKDPFISQAIQSFRLHNDPKHFAQLIRRKRLESWINSQHDTLSKAKEDNPFIPHPFGARASELDGPLRLGVINEQGDPLGFHPNDFTRNLQIYGETGSGKSTAIYMLLREILEMPDRDFNIIIIDTKRDYLPLVNDHPFAVVSSETLRENPWEPPPGVPHESHISLAVQAFTETNYFMDIGTRFFEIALRRCYQEMPSVGGEPAHPSFSELLHEVEDVIHEKKAKKLGGGQFADYALKIDARLESIIEKGSALNCHKGIPWDFWLQKDSIITLPADISEYFFKTFIMSLWSKLFNYRMQKNERGSVLRTLFVCDEAYRIFNAELDHEKSVSTRMLKDLIRQGREFGIGWIIGAQSPQDISQVIREQAAQTICFKTKALSQEEAARIMGLDKKQAEHLNRLPRSFGAVARSISDDLPFQMQIPAPDIPGTKGVDEEKLAKATEEELQPYLDRIEAFNRLAEATYGGTREYQQNLLDKANQQKQQRKARENGQLLLELLRDDPYLYRSKLKEQSGLRHDLFNEAIAWLEKKRMIERVKCITAKNGRKSEFFPLTEAAGERTRPSHFKHTYYCDMIAELLKRDHKIVKREYTDGDNHGRIDVATVDDGNLEAYEITLSNKNVLDNANKCIEFKAKRIIFVCESKKDTRSIQNILTATPPSEQYHIEVVEMPRLLKIISN